MAIANFFNMGTYPFGTCLDTHHLTKLLCRVCIADAILQHYDPYVSHHHTDDKTNMDNDSVSENR